jgi:hypothetical protein
LPDRGLANETDPLRRRAKTPASFRSFASDAADRNRTRQVDGRELLNSALDIASGTVDVTIVGYPDKHFLGGGQEASPSEKNILPCDCNCSTSPVPITRRKVAPLASAATQT